MDMQDYQVQSMNLMESIEKFINKKNFENENNEEDDSCAKLLLGWISTLWMNDNSPEASKWCKCMQHMVDSWDERNEQAYNEKSNKKI